MFGAKEDDLPEEEEEDPDATVAFSESSSAGGEETLLRTTWDHRKFREPPLEVPPGLRRTTRGWRDEEHDRRRQARAEPIGGLQIPTGKPSVLPSIHRASGRCAGR
mmetsp:Transcript_20070/g.47053  ORF Transcript_20070/g.47053 Transcript_20070/m.47053 type:complete len:106 (-) Transcript_20070:732-1049(-)